MSTEERDAHTQGIRNWWAGLSDEEREAHNLRLRENYQSWWAGL